MSTRKAKNPRPVLEGQLKNKINMNLHKFEHHSGPIPHPDILHKYEMVHR